MGKRRDSQLTWFNRAGRALGTVGEPGVYYDPAVSPDRAMLAVEQGDAVRGTTDLWIVNLARCAFSRLTSAPGLRTSRHGLPMAALRSRPIRGRARDSREDRERHRRRGRRRRGRSFPMNWSRDGRYLLFTTGGGATRRYAVGSRWTEVDAAFRDERRQRARLARRPETGSAGVRDVRVGATGARSSVRDPRVLLTGRD